MQSKGNAVTLSIQTNHFGSGTSNKQAGTLFGKKVAHKLDRIENNLLAVSVTILFVYQELLPSMMDVGSVSTWELFKILYTCTAVAKFNKILFNVSRPAFLVIDSELNKKICDAPGDTGTEVKNWIKKTRNVRRTVRAIHCPTTTSPSLHLQKEPPRSLLNGIRDPRYGHTSMAQPTQAWMGVCRAPT